ncbi:MAG TPA: hypothetical protein VF017_15470 [Thermoanaerobaculia bacterium]|nr:hypothetical protein [Thermoanaerobaculia bacterium]
MARKAPGTSAPPKKRKYTASAATRAQRRGAAWKHGRSAQTVLRQAIPPCKDATCPAHFPCDLRRRADEEKRPLEVCPVAIGNGAALAERYRKAMETGDLRPLSEAAALSLGTMHGLFDAELVHLAGEGLVVDEAVLSPAGIEIGSKKVGNPRAPLLFQLANLVGLTARDQAVTRKSQAEQQRDEGIGGLLEAVAANRRKVLGQ